jgi:hypothetical protein
MQKLSERKIWQKITFPTILEKEPAWSLHGVMSWLQGIATQTLGLALGL